MTERWLPYGGTVVVGMTPVRVLASARHDIISASTLVWCRQSQTWNPVSNLTGPTYKRDCSSRLRFTSVSFMPGGFQFKLGLGIV